MCRLFAGLSFDGRNTHTPHTAPPCAAPIGSFSASLCEFEPLSRAIKPYLDEIMHDTEVVARGAISVLWLCSQTHFFLSSSLVADHPSLLFEVVCGVSILRLTESWRSYIFCRPLGLL